MASVKKVKGPSGNPAADLVARLRKEIGPVLDEGIRIREEFTRDWSGYNTPDFYKIIDIRGGKLIAEIQFEANVAPGSTEGLSVYELLREGTEVRRANLTPGWQSKTSANSLETKPGRGSVIDVKRTYEFPGIDARNQDELANEKIAGKMQDAINRAVQGR